VLRFPFFGVPVSVHLSFGLVALFGLGSYRGWDLVAWTLAVFVAVLLHESGHAFTARLFGAGDVTITLFALGGYTTWRPTRPLDPWRRFLISAAGSAVGIALGLAVLLAGRRGAFGSAPEVVFTFLNVFILAGLVWGVLNWIPILPLDGGHMLESLLEMVVPARAAAIARVVSVVVGVALIGVALYYRQTFLALFLGLIVLSGVRSRSAPRPPPRQSSPPKGATIEGKVVEDEETPRRDETQATEPDPPAFPI
jgi:Zn-dependent protease